MKKIIITVFLMLMTILMICAFTENKEPKEEEVEIENTVHAEYVSMIIPAIDREIINIDNYTLAELETLISQKKSDIMAAKQLAVSAEVLGMSSDADLIETAHNELKMAQNSLKAFEEAYKEKYEKLEMEKWENRMYQYPAATQIWLYMKDLGWSDYVCAGIMGNLMAEVGGHSLNIRYTTHTNSGYYGMCMWSAKYAPSVIGRDLEGQCDYLRDTIKREIDSFGSHYYSGFNFYSFLNLTNEKDVALAFAKTYERCGGGDYAKRQSNATRAYNYFVN